MVAPAPGHFSGTSTSSARVVEVTQLVSNPQTCPFCSQNFSHHHALNVHIGKRHKDRRSAKETNPTVKNRRRDELRVHSQGGLPQCKHCFRKFYGWPQFMGHFDRQACPVLHKWSPEHTGTVGPEPLQWRTQPPIWSLQKGGWEFGRGRAAKV